MPYCSNCLVELKPNARFCHKCGKMVGEPKETGAEAKPTVRLAWIPTWDPMRSPISEALRPWYSFSFVPPRPAYENIKDEELYFLVVKELAVQELYLGPEKFNAEIVTRTSYDVKKFFTLRAPTGATPETLARAFGIVLIDAVELYEKGKVSAIKEAYTDSSKVVIVDQWTRGKLLKRANELADPVLGIILLSNHNLPSSKCMRARDVAVLIW